MSMQNRLNDTIKSVSLSVLLCGGSILLGRSVNAQTAIPGYTLSLFAQGPTGTSGADSIAVDDSNVYVGFGDGTASDGSDGKPTTIAHYDSRGTLIGTYTVPGHNDGLRIDPTTHQLWALQNQDGNPNLAIINPGNGSQTVYNIPSLHGGGYDDVAFANGKAYISASNPTLDGSGNNQNASILSLSIAGNTVSVTPVLQGFNVSGVNVTDPDALTADPNGSLVLTGEADQELFYVTNSGTGSQSTRILSMPDVMDETVFVPSQGGIMLVTDGKRNNIYALQSSRFMSGLAYIGSTGGNYLALLDTANGGLTQVVTGINAHGEAFLSVPEPGVISMLLGAGVSGMNLLSRRRRRS